MFVTIGFFSACSKGENLPPNNNDTDLSQGGEGSGEEDSGSGDAPQEVYVPYTSSEIMMAGANIVDGFFADFEINTTDEEMFDDNIGEDKILFLNASKMLKVVSQIENLTFGACLKGKTLTEPLDGKPNAVSKFYVTFAEEDSNGFSSVKLRILFAYNGLDVTYDYDYYDFLIETNKAQNIVSCEISIERSKKMAGVDDSTATYFNIELDGKISGEQDDLKYNIYNFDRNEKIETQTDANYNHIKNFEQSYYLGNLKTYISTEDSDLLLRSSSSEQSILVAQKVGNLNQGLKKLSGGVFGTITGLTEALVVCVDAETEIV